MLNFKLLFVGFFAFFFFIESSSAQYRPAPPRAPRAPRAPRYPRYPEPPRRPMPIPVPRPDYPAPGHVTCSAADNGWEEHWGGHGSCGECVREHGNCTETCSENFQVCEVEGRDYNGHITIFRGSGPDRWYAESEARRSCEWSRDMRSCYTVSCSSESRVVSRRRCR